MKKLLSLVLAMLMVFSMAVVASAENTTTLTTTVPTASYTLNIPADQEIPFGQTSTDIGAITVTESAGFASGKNLRVTITYDGFTCPDTTTTIPFSFDFRNSMKERYTSDKEVSSGGYITFWGNVNGNVTTKASAKSGGFSFNHTELLISSVNWGKALAGEYTATITFTAEVVVE